MPSSAPSPTMPASPMPERAIGIEPPRAARRRVRRRRRVAAAVAILLPIVWITWSDLIRRGALVADFPEKYKYVFAGGVGEGLLLWTLLLAASLRRRGVLRAIFGFLFVTCFTIVIGVQSAFHAVWNTYLSIDGQLHSKDLPLSIFGSLPLYRPLVLFHLFLHALAAIAFLHLARRTVRVGPWLEPVLAFFAVLAVGASTQIPTSYRGVQASTPDALYIHGMTGLVKELTGMTHDSPDRRVQRRRPEKVPALAPRPERPRNVVLIVQESQRADVSCVEHDPNCDKATPFSNAVTKDRFPLKQMRANASTTAISISNLWSGVAPYEKRDLMHSVPLMWEYAAAAGYDTAYWTSQNLMFGNARMYIQELPISHGCVGTHLHADADLDAGGFDYLLTEWVKKDWPEMKEPFFAVVHYSNVHYPYIYDDDLAPFRPSEMSKAPEKNEDFFNYYKNVVFLSDVGVGELMRYIRSTDAGKRTVVIHTSDHGESFREHWQMGHTSALYDEEVLVPTWIDAPEGTLSPAERESIAGAKDQFVWHLDVAPTMLDLLGVWDAPELAPFRARMIGHPITRPERTLGPVPMTNCTWVWECAFRNWGMMQGSRKIEAREWDGTFHCFDLLDDPHEKTDLGERLCAPLPDLARQIFPSMPNVTPPGRPEVDWGKN